MPKKTKKPTKPLKPVLATMLLDETGSMLIRKEMTLSAVNEYIGGLKADAKVELDFTLMTFNSAKKSTRILAKPIKDVPVLKNKDYEPDSTTPLYDAIAEAIRQAEETKKEAGRPYDVIMVIVTDGEENASHEFDRTKIFDLIAKKKDAGWSFVYIGANQDAWKVGQSMGVPAANTMTYDPAKIASSMRRASAGTAAYVNDSRVRSATLTGSSIGGFWNSAGGKFCMDCGKLMDTADHGDMPCGKRTSA